MLNKKMNKKGKEALLAGIGGGMGLIIIIAVVFGALYVMKGGGYGVEVSCATQEILGFKKVPAPLLAVVQPEECKIDYEVKFNNAILCGGEYTIKSERGVAPCSQLEDYSGKELLIEVLFYDASTNELLGDDKDLKVFQR